MTAKKSQPFVSVVISTKNEEKHIDRCLSHIQSQNYSSKKIEIIVVDNYSTDKTVKIAKQYTKKVFTKGPERSAQRNFGVTKSRGEYILYLDADMYLSKNVIIECVLRMQENPKFIGLYIRESIKGKGYFGAVRRFERAFYNATVIDGLRFLKKSSLVKIGGFDEKLYACEDWDLDKRIKKLGNVDFIDQPLFHNDGRSTLKEYLLKKIYYSFNFSQYIKKWGASDPEVKKQFGLYYRYFGVFVENGKWRQLVRHPELTVGMYFLKFLVGVLYLFRRIKVKIFYEILHIKQ